MVVVVGISPLGARLALWGARWHGGFTLGRGGALVSFREVGLVRVGARRAKPNHAGISIVCLSVSIAKSSASISTA